MSAWLSFGTLSGVLLISVLVPPMREAPVSLCLIQLLAGIAGPGCGMTRAFLFLGHGDLEAALEMNPASPLAFALVIGLWIDAAARIARGRGLTLAVTPAGRRGLIVAAVIVTVAVWIYNLRWNPWV